MTHLKIEWTFKLLGNLINMQYLIQLSGVGPKFCVSTKLPGDDNNSAIYNKPLT